MRRLLHTVKGKTSILPPWYTQLEYIQADATKINLGFKTTKETEVECTWMKPNSTAQYLYQSDSWSNLSRNTTAYLSSGWWNWRFWNRTISIVIEYNKKVVSIQNQIWVTFDWASKWTYGNMSDFTSVNDFGLFWSGAWKTIIYDLIIRNYTSRDVEHHYIPCKNSDDEVWVYDVIKDVFYEWGIGWPEK